MKFMMSVYTDIGIKKKTNQDSALLLEAETDKGQMLLAVLCDGMGGLAKGEVASAALIQEFKRWFHEELPMLVYQGIDSQTVFDAFGNIAFDMNARIGTYGMNVGVSLGTTVVAMLFFDGWYYIMNVGDSRAYRMSDNICQLTKDQTFIQREIDMGRMTPEQARVSSQRNVLLQCIGASEMIKPDFYCGEVSQGDCFLLCCDGFRHEITPEEFYVRMNPLALKNETVMYDTLVYFTELNKSRHETDNITALLVRVD